MFGIGKDITVMFGNVLFLRFLLFLIPLHIFSAEMSSAMRFFFGAVEQLIWDPIHLGGSKAESMHLWTLETSTAAYNVATGPMEIGFCLLPFVG